MQSVFTNDLHVHFNEWLLNWMLGSLTISALFVFDWLAMFFLDISGCDAIPTCLNPAGDGNWKNIYTALIIEASGEFKKKHAKVTFKTNSNIVNSETDTLCTV